ncbi:MAG: ATP-grasp domain-containing protein [Pedobacter sp.]|nr:ATP-grasp domain-containing protein [Chitinophagaceae bacterium]
MKICVLQPDYSTSAVDYQYYDPPRELQPLLPNDEVDTIFLNKLTTYKQLKALQHRGYDIFVNLCEGYLEWEVPSIDVIYTLELLNLPFTGPTSKLYDPPKELMKYVAFCADVATPSYILISSINHLEKECEHLQFPLFVKPAKAGDSLGIDDASLVKSQEELLKKVTLLLTEYDELLVEEYIAGREFTVMLAANADGKTCTTFKPVEYIFPDNFQYKTYALKTSELHSNANIPCNDSGIEKQLRSSAEKIFKGFGGVGYGRLDFRMDATGKLYFLEINFTCSVFYTNGYEGSADYILQHDGFGQQRFLQHIIAEGIARYKRQQKKYAVKGNAIAGYGIYATQNMAVGDLVFQGEGKSQRIVTKAFVAANWNSEAQENFRRYAYPISDEVFILWDNDPQEWAPQNHCCQPNTAYKGLNVYAINSIAQGEELTLDYTSFLDDKMQPFNCKCGTLNCKGLIQGTANNTITEREKNAK